jgi:DNA-binding CsgD family transcriptional regulator
MLHPLAADGAGSDRPLAVAPHLVASAPRLTPQETWLLALLVEGHHKKTAADAMGISINTVSFHLKNIYTKLEVHSKTEAVVKALLGGLLPLARG